MNGAKVQFIVSAHFYCKVYLGFLNIRSEGKEFEILREHVGIFHGKISV